MGPLRVLGCDFSSRPSARKPITLALGNVLCDGRVALQELRCFESLQAWSEWLALPADPAWVGGFDLPFGLPRELVQQLGWPTDWGPCMDHYAGLTRERIRELFKAFCAARPAGGKFAHRATDGPAGASPSMKWVNPPVAYMMHAGVPALRAAGAHLPGLAGGDPSRVALEAYPGLLARELIGARSYKADDRARQTPERLIARKDLIEALEQGRTRLGLRLRLTHAQRDDLAADASGDRLDAVLCLVQAAWARNRFEAGDRLYGLPPSLDPLEGWIVTSE